jgi:hypothetical protein
MPSREGGHKGATDRILHRRRSAVREGTRAFSITAKVWPSLPCRQTASAYRVDGAYRTIVPVTRHGIESSDARTTTPRRSRRDPRRAIRSLSGGGARLPPRLRRRSRRRLSDTAGPPIGAVDRNIGLTQCRRSRTCWMGFRSDGTTCHPASQTARWRKRSMPCWSCARK